MDTVRLDTMGVIYYFEFEIQEEKQKAVWRAVIGIWVGKTKRESVVCS